MSRGLLEFVGFIGFIGLMGFKGFKGSIGFRARPFEGYVHGISLPACGLIHVVRLVGTEVASARDTNGGPCSTLQNGNPEHKPVGL